MKTLTASIDGQNQIDELAKTVTEWQFLASGEWSQGPHHEGNFTMDIGWSADKDVYVLRYLSTPLDDGDDDFEYDDDEESDEVGDVYQNVAAGVECKTMAAQTVVTALVEAASESGDVEIDDYVHMGDFDL